ncbi:MAG TPA: alpha/beta hydrolase [Burkholderiales bacterium]|nr:alpha/beta hydrolase [Burkholderiales bacterium]
MGDILRWLRSPGRAIVLVLCAALAGLAADAGRPPGPVEPFVKELLYVPADGGNYYVAVGVLRPSGIGPYGAIVLNHGTPATVAERNAESPAAFFHAATEFARRGYAVFMPLRRGYGATGGAFAEDAGSCAAPRYASAERAAAQDVLAAYEFARGRPYVDSRRMILAGQSAGGVAALQAAAYHPEGLVAVLAFAAGRGGDPYGTPGVPCAGAALGELFADLGAAVRVPVLLQYAQNDRFFGPQASQEWFSRFKSAGAKAEYVLQPPFGRDGHFLLTDPSGTSVWLPAVERFLERYGVPFAPPSTEGAQKA